MAINKKSDDEVSHVVQAFKQRCANANLLDDQGAVDLKRVFEDLSLVVTGWSMEVLETHEMPHGYLGLTLPDRKIIQLANPVYDGLCLGDKEHRFTGAHELGHMIMHHDFELARAEATCDSISLSAELESEADEFARQLLGFNSPACEQAKQETKNLIQRLMALSKSSLKKKRSPK